MELRRPPLRITLLLGVAVLMAGLIVLDQAGHLPDGGEQAAPRRRPVAPPAAVATADAAAASVAPPSSAPAAAPWQQLADRYAELKGYVEGKDGIERAYARVSGPYAEAIATYGATYSAGNRPGDSLDRLVRQHLSGRLRLVELKITPAERQGAGRYTSTARISLLAADSLAMAQAILNLGNPDNGLLWKELSVVVDSGKKTLRLDGQLALTLVESAE